MAHMGPTDLIGVNEAAEIVGVSTRTIKRLALNGELPYRHKLNGATGAYLFEYGTVVNFAAERQERAA